MPREPRFIGHSTWMSRMGSIWNLDGRPSPAQTLSLISAMSPSSFSACTSKDLIGRVMSPVILSK
jgi:hypothetical protein